jgi:predicted DNA-binding transcriptional regulator AlpA
VLEGSARASADALAGFLCPHPDTGGLRHRGPIPWLRCRAKALSTDRDAQAPHSVLGRRSVVNREEARKLSTVVDLPTAGRMLGIGRSAAYELVRAGEWPTPVLRLGRLIRVPTAPLLELLGERQRPVA